MEEEQKSTRRDFVRDAALVAGGLLGSPMMAAEAVTNVLCVFNKPLQHLDYEAQAELVAEMGFAGIEGTVRAGGHVEPERVRDDLPRQIEALRKNGLEMTIMTTDVNDVGSEPHRVVLQTAVGLGVRRFRMGGIKLDLDRPIPAQLVEIRGSIEKLVQFCRPLGIQPLYQNHAGAGRFGAAIWDLYEVLKDFDPADIGIAFDIRHATVEGGQSWPTEFHLLRPWFGAAYCKDFVWREGKERPENVPLGTGRVDYPAFLKRLKGSGYRGPISLHMEYKAHRDPGILDEAVAAIRTDKAKLEEFLK